MGSEHEPQIMEYWCHACSHMVRLTAEADIDPVCSFCSSTFVEEINTSPGSPDQDSPLPLDEILHEWIPILENLLNSFPRFSAQDSNHNILQRKRHRKEVIARLLDVIYAIKRHLSSGNSLKGISDLSFGPQFDHILLYLTENPPRRYHTDDLMMPKVNSLLQYIDDCDCDTDLGVSTVRIDRSSSGENCPICLDGFVVGQDVSMVPCKHMFHSKCIKTWLQMHNSCPVCRFTLPGPSRRCTVEDSNSVRRNQRRRPRFWVQSRWLFCMCFCRGHGPASPFGTG